MEWQKQKQKEESANGDEKTKLLSLAYDEVIERICGQKQGLRELALKVLAWVTCARTPLRVTAIQHALAVEIDDVALDEENIPEIDDIVSVCAGLVNVDEEAQVIRLVHYTTYEYLRHNQEKLFPDAHADMAAICITYLSFEELQLETYPKWYMDRLDENDQLELDQQGTTTHRSDWWNMYRNWLAYKESKPFLTYAASSWGYHFQDLPRLYPLVLGFLENPRHIAILVVVLTMDFRYLEFLSRDKFTTKLHMAASIGADGLIRKLLQEPLDVNAIDPFLRSALFHAIEAENLATVRLLIETGADLNMRDRNEVTPLSLALWLGIKEIIDILLERGADVHVKNWGHETTLMWAVRSRYANENTVSLLLGQGVDVNALDMYKDTALHCSVRLDRVAIAKLLLDHGAEVDALDYNGESSLVTATKSNSPEMVNLLLRYGANPMLGDKAGKTALNLASHNVRLRSYRREPLGTCRREY